MAVEILIYTTRICGYCQAAKRLLTQHQWPFTEIDCSEDPATRERLVELTGQRTVPQIFIGGVPVGGYSELAALDRAGRLAAIVAGDEAPPPVGH